MHPSTPARGIHASIHTCSGNPCIHPHLLGESMHPSEACLRNQALPDPIAETMPSALPAAIPGTAVLLNRQDTILSRQQKIIQKLCEE